VLCFGTIPKIAWKPNPTTEKVTAYEVWRDYNSKPDVFLTVVTGTTFQPNDNGYYYVKAVNARGTGPKSSTIHVQ
jgi:hypothetical protein